MVALITPVFNIKWGEASKQGLSKHPTVKSIHLLRFPPGAWQAIVFILHNNIFIILEPWGENGQIDQLFRNVSADSA